MHKTPKKLSVKYVVENDAIEIPIMPEAQKSNLADSRKLITYFMDTMLVEKSFQRSWLTYAVITL